MSKTWKGRGKKGKRNDFRRDKRRAKFKAQHQALEPTRPKS